MTYKKQCLPSGGKLITVLRQRIIPRSDLQHFKEFATIARRPATEPMNAHKRRTVEEEDAEDADKEEAEAEAEEEAVARRHAETVARSATLKRPAGNYPQMHT